LFLLGVLQFRLDKKVCLFDTSRASLGQESG
jgi:hypothetical protein